jgi:hypothetical protein
MNNFSSRIMVQMYSKVTSYGSTTFLFLISMTALALDSPALRLMLMSLNVEDVRKEIVFHKWEEGSSMLSALPVLQTALSHTPPS